MKPEDREKLLIEGAIEYFSEVGFGGDTRELAKRVGVTQSLLFKYFGQKDALVERVYNEVFFKKWKAEWSVLIADIRFPLAHRINTFYREYSSIFLERRWIRIFMYAGLKGTDFITRFLAMVQSMVLNPICEQLRLEFNLKPVEVVPITHFEEELILGLHGQIAYLAIRKWVYGSPIDLSEIQDTMSVMIEVFLVGAREAMSRRIPSAG